VALLSFDLGQLMKRRAGLFAFVGTAVAVSLVSGALGSVSSSSSLIASGSFHGVAWRLTGNDWSGGTYCLTMKIPASSKSVGSGGCGSINVPGRYGPHGISYLTHAGIPLPNYVVGPVVATARVVQITLSNGLMIRTRTIPPRRGLVSGIRFYAVELPCPALPTQFRALDATGRIVAHLNIPARIGFRGKITC
jgi:hypothetical protein